MSPHDRESHVGRKDELRGGPPCPNLFVTTRRRNQGGRHPPQELAQYEGFMGSMIFTRLWNQGGAPSPQELICLRCVCIK